MGARARRSGGNQHHRSMTKGEQRQNRRDNQSRRNAEKQSPVPPDNVYHLRSIKPIEYLTDNQRRLGATIRAHDATFASGPIGTGKTHIAIAEAMPWFFSNKDNILVFTNPAVEIGEKLGTLPGDKDEKIAVSMRPLRDILNKLLGASHVDNLVSAGRILFEPLGSILGTTFDDAWIVFDEAQNATPQQMKAMLTRVGKRSKIIIAGDYKEQLFIDGMSGMEDALHRLRHSSFVGHIEFTVDDIVRSDFAKEVIIAYRREDEG